MLSGAGSGHTCYPVLAWIFVCCAFVQAARAANFAFNRGGKSRLNMHRRMKSCIVVIEKT